MIFQLSYTNADVERFIAKVIREAGPLEDDCWIWLGAKSRGRGNLAWYGSFSVAGLVIRAHKFSFLALGKGIWTPGHHLDHLCENSLCVNPHHLEMVTREVNQERKQKRRFDYDRRH